MAEEGPNEKSKKRTKEDTSAKAGQVWARAAGTPVLVIATSAGREDIEDAATIGANRYRSTGSPLET